MSDASTHAVREATVGNRQGLHARPVMQFVDLASSYSSRISVTNVSKSDERLDGKSAMEMMLLDAPQGNVLRIEARGEDACIAVDALAALVEAGFKSEPSGKAHPDKDETQP